jgi:polyhydroxybutyrate depolymerase
MKVQLSQTTILQHQRQVIICLIGTLLLVFMDVPMLAAAGFGSGGKDVMVDVKWVKDKTRNGPIDSPGEYGREIQFGGAKRFLKIHVPPKYNKANATPLILVFHGGGGYPDAIRYESRMDELSDREGFIVIYPGGTNKRLVKDRILEWNDGRPYQDGSPKKVDDVGFVSAMLDDLRGLLNIDYNRVYAAGFSNGAQLCYRLAKQLTHRIAAIGTVAGQRPARDDIPTPPRPISVIQFSGRQDTIAPYDGGSPHFEAKFKTELLPVEKTIRSWVEFNGCRPEPSAPKRIDQAVMKRWGPCKDETEVVLWTLEDGGHTWPGGRTLPAAKKWGQGNTSQSIWASEAMWNFFKTKSLRGK